MVTDSRSVLLQSLARTISDFRRDEIAPITPTHVSQEKVMRPQDCRTYHRNECAVFLKTAEQFGGLSNMADGYPLVINGRHLVI